MNKGHKHTDNHYLFHGSDDNRGKRMFWVTLLNLSITVVQLIGGFLSNSLSLISDAVHNLGDTSAIFIAYVAGKVAIRKPDEHKTFGYKRAEIIAALFNAVVLISISLFLFVEAYKRLLNPEPIQGKLMVIIALFGLLANLYSVLILHGDKEHNLNIKAAYLHLLGDTLSSVAVILGAIAILMFKVYWIDPLITVFVGCYIIWHTWGIVKQTIDILMQSTPVEIDLNEIKKEVELLRGIGNIHHVHVWRLDDKQIHIEAHVNLTEDISMSEMMVIQTHVENLLKDKFGINHITLQMGYNCCDGNPSLIFRKEKE